ncbi:MAG: molybdopterin-guanine dinucleotide biosynthesis protein MobA [Solirubrobacterales bacterium]|nr:molybdopterin-guanine dinucleotide biosynthesis protein MobA [Solirubrobacterales bacterium]
MSTTDQEPRLFGVLLAAGAARRFGSPKQLAELDGRPLVLHALGRMLCLARLERVLVVVGAHGDAVAATLEEAGWEGVEVVRCPDWEEGMGASLRTGVAAAARAGADAVLVHLADLPRVTPHVMSRVLETACDARGDLLGVPARASYGGEDGHPVVLPAELFPGVAALRGDTGARELLAGPGTLRFEAGHLADPTDVDTPETLESLT